MTAVPLSAYGKPYTPAAGAVNPSIYMKTAVREQVNAMDAASHFKLFAELLKTNPPGGHTLSDAHEDSSHARASSDAGLRQLLQSPARGAPARRKTHA
jgi:hypothetical protein